MESEITRKPFVKTNIYIDRTSLSHQLNKKGWNTRTCIEFFDGQDSSLEGVINTFDELFMKLCGRWCWKYGRINFHIQKYFRKWGCKGVQDGRDEFDNVLSFSIFVKFTTIPFEIRSIRNSSGIDMLVEYGIIFLSLFLPSQDELLEMEEHRIRLDSSQCYGQT